MDAPNGKYVAGGGRCGSCLAPVALGRDRCEKCKSYDQGYADATGDIIAVLLAPPVMRAARIGDADELAVQVGHRLAEGESSPADWPAPTRGGGG